ncbi:MAG: hypothetical protein AAF664_02880 [Planctomycetota bacterium]
MMKNQTVLGAHNGVTIFHRRPSFSVVLPPPGAVSVDYDVATRKRVGLFIFSHRRIFFTVWHTSQGDRTLDGAEAILVASAIDTMIDALMVHVDEDDTVNARIPECESGIAIFDRLNACQRIGLLHQLANYLLTQTSRPLPLSAVVEAGVAAIYVEIRDQLAIEVDLCDELPPGQRDHWRRMVQEAYDEKFSDAFVDDVAICKDARDREIDDEPFVRPAIHQRDINEWETVVDILASAVLWDRDFELSDWFLDQDPGLSSHRRDLLGIDQDYFIGVTPDPKPGEYFQLILRTREIVAVKPRYIIKPR